MKLPDICKNSVLLYVILYTQMLATALFSLIEDSWSFERFGFYTLYFQWYALGCLFVLCKLRGFINQKSSVWVVLTSFAICIGMFLIVELSSFYFFSRYFPISQPQPWDFVRRFVACLIFLILLFRLIGVLGILERRNRAEAKARLNALQSRIRPHFLFNSLNTVSELVATDPVQAENAIQSLAKLFRANLQDENASHSLAAELDLCKRYLRLERWRLGDKLDVKLDKHVKRTSRWVVPHLILQPLVENAVIHGKDQTGAVKITIDVRETASHLSVMIENGVGDASEVFSDGNGIAIDNIKERLFVLYDDDYSFKVRRMEDSYQVIMRIPKQDIRQP